MTNGKSTHKSATALRTKRSAARVGFLVHSAAGLWLTILLSIVMITGTLAVFTPELDRLFFSSLHSSPPTPDAEKLDSGVIYDAVAKAYPGMGITYIDTFPHDKYASATTTVILPGNVKRKLAIHAYTGEILGEIPPMTLQPFIMYAHATLFQRMPGFYAVNFCGLIILVLIGSGMIAYKKFWRGLFKRIRTGFGWRVLVGDLHRLLAVWSLPFLLIIGMTGAWYFYNFPLVQLGLAPEVVPPAHAPATLTSADLDALGPEPPTRLSGAEVVKIVQAAYPDMTVTGLMPPINLNMSFAVSGDSGGYLHGKDPDVVYVNPFSGAIMGAHLSRDQPFTQLLFKGMSQLHHGELLPVSWGYTARMIMKTIWFLFGVIGSFLTISGLLLYLKRSREALPWLSWRRLWNWVKPWSGPMKIFKYVNVLAAVGLIVGITYVTAPKPQKAAPPKVAYSSRSTGAFDVSLTVLPGPRSTDADPRQPGSRVMVFPRIAKDRFPQARAILVGVTGGKGASGRGVRVKGAENLAFASVRLPKDLSGVELWVEIRQWDGTSRRTHWPLHEGAVSNPS